MKASLSIPTGKYTGKDGTEKTSYTTIGKLLETKNGHSIKLDPMITNYLKLLFWQSFEGWVNLYEEKEKEHNPVDDIETLPF